VSIVTVEGIQDDSGAWAWSPRVKVTLQELAEGGRIFIVRHAQSAANAGGRTADSATIPITDTGNRQAQRVADLVPSRRARALQRARR